MDEFWELFSFVYLEFKTLFMNITLITKITGRGSYIKFYVSNLIQNLENSSLRILIVLGVKFWKFLINITWYTPKLSGLGYPLQKVRSHFDTFV